MKNKIYPCIWFDGNAIQAAEFYCSVFKDSKINSFNPWVAGLTIMGYRFMFLNGGAKFKPNPTMSFYTTFETIDEIEEVWKKLLGNGKVVMPLDRYGWSEKYGWVEDQYGVSWQLTLGRVLEIGQKIVPALMFTGEQFGYAGQAIEHYCSIFKNAKVNFIHRYDENDKIQGGKIDHARFSLSGQPFIAMDSGLVHNYSFTEGLSLVVECETQNEIDFFWESLTEGGMEGQCGWLKDKYGFSWQVVPSHLGRLMNDPLKSEKVMNVILGMKKLEIDLLENA